MKVLCAMDIPKYLYSSVWSPRTEESLHHVREGTGRSADPQHQFMPAVDGAEFPGACGPQKPGYLNHFQEIAHFHRI